METSKFNLCCDFCLLLVTVKQVLLTSNKLCGKLQTNYLHLEGVANVCRRKCNRAEITLYASDILDI